MKKYLVCHVHVGEKVEICQARRLNKEEKNDYAPWFGNVGFVAIGDSTELIYLDYLEVVNFLNRKSDGQFVCSAGEVYIISEQERDKLLEMDKDSEESMKQAEKDRKITELREMIRQCESTDKLYTRKEATEKRKQYRDMYNEGADGYIPHFWTVDEYESAKAELHQLLSE